MLFISFISRRFIEDIISRGRMPQVKTLIEFSFRLEQLTMLIRPLTISTGEFWFKLLVPRNITKIKNDENLAQ